MFHLGSRVTLTIADGPFAGVSCDVDSIDSETILFAVVAMTGAFAEAVEVPAEVEALRALYAFFEGTGRPVWNVCGPRGPIPPTAAGMMFVPGALVLQLTALWQATFLGDAP